MRSLKFWTSIMILIKISVNTHILTHEKRLIFPPSHHLEFSTKQRVGVEKLFDFQFLLHDSLRQLTNSHIFFSLFAQKRGAKNNKKFKCHQKSKRGMAFNFLCFFLLYSHAILPRVYRVVIHEVLKISSPFSTAVCLVQEGVD